MGYNGSVTGIDYSLAATAQHCAVHASYAVHSTVSLKCKAALRDSLICSCLLLSIHLILAPPPSVPLAISISSPDTSLASYFYACRRVRSSWRTEGRIITGWCQVKAAYVVPVIRCIRDVPQPSAQDCEQTTSEELSRRLITVRSHGVAVIRYKMYCHSCTVTQPKHSQRQMSLERSNTRFATLPAPLEHIHTFNNSRTPQPLTQTTLSDQMGKLLDASFLLTA